MEPHRGGTIRLHALSVNARGPVQVQLDGQLHELASGSPAVVHEIATGTGPHEILAEGRVRLGRTGRAAAAVDVPPGGVVDVFYALPAVPRMRGELSGEPDVVPGQEWRWVLGGVVALVGVVWLTWFAWLLFAET